MHITSAFVAFPSDPSELADTLQAGVTRLRDTYNLKGIESWQQNDIAGQFLADPVFRQIREKDVLIADVTHVNFNVTYEIGFAIGACRRVFLVRNASLVPESDLIKEIGIFDTLGYVEYSNSDQFAKLILGASQVGPLQFEATGNRKSPVYHVKPHHTTDAELRIAARIKRARLAFREFDPQEVGRLSAYDAIENVGASHGVVVSLVSPQRNGFRVSNTRAAFVAGLAAGMRKVLLMLQEGDDPVPLDFRDLVRVHRHLDQINEYVADFATEVTASLQTTEATSFSDPAPSGIASLHLGAPAAENEEESLGIYFMQTDEFQRTARGECQVVAGRKGSGKTAMFVQLRNTLRRTKSNVVLDLRPESYQLRKFRDVVTNLLAEGSREHAITAFWEYLLWLEVCHKILQKDQQRHLADHTLYEPYRRLESLYRGDGQSVTGDFAERMTALLSRISEGFTATRGGLPDETLSRAELTERLYVHDLPELRSHVLQYLGKKNGVWILVDNLDKGWPSHGVTSDDTLIVRCLVEAMFRISKSFRREEVHGFGVLFIRNDVYDLLIDHTADRGKISRANIDWDDADLLRELIRLRMTAGSDDLRKLTFNTVWGQFCASHIDGEESSQYLIDRCLMRPRALIELIGHCRSHAVNLNKAKIEEDDFVQGEAAFSSNLVINISLEMRDIIPQAEDFAYGFLECKSRLTESELEECITNGVDDNCDIPQLLDVLLWFGFVGIVRGDGSEAYIHSVKYDMKRLKALIVKQQFAERIYCINKAFWAGLEVKEAGV